MWFRRMASRRSRSIVASASWPARTSPVDAGPVREEPLHGQHRVLDLGHAGLGDDGAGVADLTAALGVEGGAIEEDLDHPAAASSASARRLRLRGPWLGPRSGIGLEHGHDPRRHLVVLEPAPDEHGRPLGLEQLAVDGFVAGPRRLGGGPGPLALGGHGGVEAGAVDLHARVVRQLLGQLDREAVRVVQGEGHVALEHLRPGGERLFQAAQPRPQRAVEPGLFTRHHVDDQVLLRPQRRVGVTQDVGGRLDQRRRDGLVDAGAAGGQDGPAHDAAQHVAPALVGGQHAVGDEHGEGAAVVGQHAQRDVGRRVGSVGGADDGRRRVDERHEQVGVEDRIDTLEDGQVPLEAGAGVDVLARQVGEDAGGVAVVLHEDEVPDLDEAVAAAVLGAAVVAEGLALVEEDLRVRAAGAGLAHGPEVVLVAHALDPLGARPTLSIQICSASSSSSWTVIQRRSPSWPRTSVSSSQAIGMASALK